jgi:hypothetical protein
MGWWSSCSKLLFGDYYLVDEISLAYYSVLERVNSLMEVKGGPSRYPGISRLRHFSTMNRRRIGLKELSWALRNRDLVMSHPRRLIRYLKSRFSNPEELTHTSFQQFKNDKRASFSLRCDHLRYFHAKVQNSFQESLVLVLPKMSWKHDFSCLEGI